MQLYSANVDEGLLVYNWLYLVLQNQKQAATKGPD